MNIHEASSMMAHPSIMSKRSQFLRCKDADGFADKSLYKIYNLRKHEKSIIARRKILLPKKTFNGSNNFEIMIVISLIPLIFMFLNNFYKLRGENQ